MGDKIYLMSSEHQSKANQPVFYKEKDECFGQRFSEVPQLHWRQPSQITEENSLTLLGQENQYKVKWSRKTNQIKRKIVLNGPTDFLTKW